MQTNFADAILNITLTGGIVRIDLGTVSAVQTQDGTKELRPTLTQQLVMPLDGFLRSFRTQESLVKKMIADGILKLPAEQ